MNARRLPNDITRPTILCYRGEGMKEEEDFYVECIACGWIVLSRQSCDCVEVES